MPKKECNGNPYLGCDGRQCCSYPVTLGKTLITPSPSEEFRRTGELLAQVLYVYYKRNSSVEIELDAGKYYIRERMYCGAREDGCRDICSHESLNKALQEALKKGQ